MKIYADKVDITGYVTSLLWKNTIAELSTTLSFSIAKDLRSESTSYVPKEGSIISVHLPNEVFLGIVLTVDDGDVSSNSYTAADFGFYLNKSKETY